MGERTWEENTDTVDTGYRYEAEKPAILLSDLLDYETENGERVLGESQSTVETVTDRGHLYIDQV